jgi:hypothetical protein
MTKISYTKKCLILSILNGSNSKIKTLCKYDITLKDILDVNTNIDKIKLYIKEYLDAKNITNKIYSCDVIKVIGIETDKIFESDGYSKDYRSKRLLDFYTNHIMTLKDERFDKRFNIDFDTEYNLSVINLLKDYEIIKKDE